MSSALPATAAVAFVAAAGTTPTLCPFQVWSHHACPLCGMTRALASFATGDISAAVRYHPVVLLLALQAAVIGLLYVRTGSRLPSSAMRWLVEANTMALAVVWLVRWRLGLLSVVVQ